MKNLFLFVFLVIVGLVCLSATITQQNFKWHVHDLMFSWHSVYVIMFIFKPQKV